MQRERERERERERRRESSRQLGEPSSGDICEDRFEMSDINDTRWDFWPELRTS